MLNQLPLRKLWKIPKISSSHCYCQLPITTANGNYDGALEEGHKPKVGVHFLFSLALPEMTDSRRQVSGLPPRSRPRRRSSVIETIHRRVSHEIIVPRLTSDAFARTERREMAAVGKKRAFAPNMKSSGRAKRRRGRRAGIFSKQRCAHVCAFSFARACVH